MKKLAYKIEPQAFVSLELESNIKSNEETCLLKKQVFCYKSIFRSFTLTAVDDGPREHDDWKDAKKVDDAQSGEDARQATALLRQNLPRRTALFGDLA